MPKVVFEAMGSQWRMASPGQLALITARSQVSCACLASRDKETDVFDGVRVMESAALRMMNRNSPSGAETVPYG